MARVQYATQESRDGRLFAGIGGRATPMMDTVISRRTIVTGFFTGTGSQGGGNSSVAAANAWGPASIAAIQTAANT
jgi:hypothetical protein